MTISDLDSARASAAAAHREFQAEGVYLNTASLGLPPRAVLRALHEVLEGWQRGEATPADYDVPVSASRRAYAQLVGVQACDVAVGSQVSVFAGLVAAAPPDHSEVPMVPG